MKTIELSVVLIFAFCGSRFLMSVVAINISPNDSEIDLPEMTTKTESLSSPDGATATTTGRSTSSTSTNSSDVTSSTDSTPTRSTSVTQTPTLPTDSTPSSNNPTMYPPTGWLYPGLYPPMISIDYFNREQADKFGEVMVEETRETIIIQKTVIRKVEDSHKDKVSESETDISSG